MPRIFSENERVPAIANLVMHLRSSSWEITPAEAFHAVRLVPGWALAKGEGYHSYLGYHVSGGGLSEEWLSRDKLLKHLKEHWLPEAQAALEAAG